MLCGCCVHVRLQHFSSQTPWLLMLAVAFAEYQREQQDKPTECCSHLVKGASAKRNVWYLQYHTVTQLLVNVDSTVQRQGEQL
jgi:hypothetical protein